MPVDTLLRGIRRVRAILSPLALNDATQTEMREYLDRATERLIARGMSAEDALVRAEAPSLPVTGMRTFAQADEQMYREMLQTAGLAGAGGALALGLPLSVAGFRIAMSQGIVIAPGVNPGLGAPYSK